MKDFIFGILFTIVILPLAQGIVEIILQEFEYLKALIGVKVVKLNEEYGLDDEEGGRQIGFCIGEPLDSEEEYDEDEED